MKSTKVAILLLLPFLITSCKKSGVNLSYADMSLPSETNIKGIFFTNSMTGFAVGGINHKEGFLYQTTDGGESWSLKLEIGSTQETLYDILFPSPNLSISSSDFMHFYKSKDGWESSEYVIWKPWIVALLPAKRLYQVNDSVLYFAGGTRYYNGTYGISRDTGNNWQQDTLSHEMSGIGFANDSVGYISGHGIILKTTNQGASYDTLQIADDFFVAIYALTEEEVVVATGQGKILRSTNGGKSWEKVYSKGFLGNQRNLNDMTFVDDLTGYAVGNYGLVLQTVDGGRNWVSVEGLPKEIYRRVIATDWGDVIIAGDNGTIIKLD